MKTVRMLQSLKVTDIFIHLRKEAGEGQLGTVSNKYLEVEMRKCNTIGGQHQRQTIRVPIKGMRIVKIQKNSYDYFSFLIS